jgi:hypothetical protein
MNLIFTSIVSVFIASAFSGAPPSTVQSNDIESFGGDSRINLNSHAVEREDSSITGFGRSEGSAQVHSVVNAGPGNIQLNDNIGSHVNVDNKLLGNLLTARKSLSI